MALQIIRNNIINVEADAIVNTANPAVAVGRGVFVFFAVHVLIGAITEDGGNPVAFFFRPCFVQLLEQPPTMSKEESAILIASFLTSDRYCDVQDIRKSCGYELAFALIVRQIVVYGLL